MYGLTAFTTASMTYEAISTFIINIQNGAATVSTSINNASPVVGATYTL